MSTTLLNPYCTLDDVQRECENHDTEDTADMLEAINLASRHIDGYCRRDYLWHDCTVSPYAVPDAMIARETIYFPWPVAEIAKIVLADGDVETVVDPKTYRTKVNPQEFTTRFVLAGKWVEADNLELAGMTSGSVISLPPEVRIYGRWGYAPQTAGKTDAPSPALPAQIRRACTVIAAIWSGKLRKQIQDISGGSTTVTQKHIPEAVIALLDAQRVSIV